MSLQQEFDAFKADFQAAKCPWNASPEVHAAMERATAGLVASGQAARAVKAGERAPRFTLKDQAGHIVSSSERISRGPLVVAFYRGAWCPYCNLELQALNGMLPPLRALGAHIVAISPQTPLNSRKVVRDFALGFPILNDVRGEISAAFGLRFALPDYLIELYRRMKNDLPVFNDDPSWTLPMPARYVIGQDGIVLYSEVNADYTQRPDPSEMMPVLEKAAGRA